MMPTFRQRSFTLLLGGLLLVSATALAADKKADKKKTNQAIENALTGVVLAELPNQVASMLKGAAPYARVDYAVDVTAAAIQLKPALAPAIVSAALTAAPFAAGPIYKMALEKVPQLAVAIQTAAFAAVPTIAPADVSLVRAFDDSQIRVTESQFSAPEPGHETQTTITKGDTIVKAPGSGRGHSSK